MRTLFKAVVGVGLPLLVFAGLFYLLGPQAGRQPAPPELTGAPAGAVAADQRPEGRWEVDPNRSYVGYRILEQNPRRYGKDEIVGRTDRVEGELRVVGDVVRDAQIRADLRGLTSNRSFRDRAIRSRFLQSNQYPDATFTLTEPVDLAPGPVPGEVFSRKAEGTLTIHGVTREVTVALEARWRGEQITVTGEIPISLPDYDVTPPRLPGFRLVDEDATIELLLEFDHPQTTGGG